MCGSNFYGSDVKIAEIFSTAAQSKTSPNLKFCFIKIARRVIYIEWLCFQCKAPFMKIFDLVTLWMMLSFWVALLSSLLMGPYNLWSWLFIFTQIRRITKFPLMGLLHRAQPDLTPSLVVLKIFKIQTVRKQGIFPVWTPDF